MKMNQTLIMLVILAIILLVGLGVYQIFLTPPETVPSTEIRPVSDYYGEDVLNFIQSN